MALSNILNEPRREITESLVGIAVLILPVYADYRFGCWFNNVVGDGLPPVDVPRTLTGMFVGILLTLILIAIAIGTHAFGDHVCEVLQDHGLQLRPNTRYGADGKAKFNSEEAAREESKRVRGDGFSWCNNCQAYHVSR
jgi:hypothetical protein